MISNNLNRISDGCQDSNSLFLIVVRIPVQLFVGQDGTVEKHRTHLRNQYRMRERMRHL